MAEEANYKHEYSPLPQNNRKIRSYSKNHLKNHQKSKNNSKNIKLAEINLKNYKKKTK